MTVQPEPQAPVPDASRWGGDVSPMTGEPVETATAGEAVEDDALEIVGEPELLRLIESIGAGEPVLVVEVVQATLAVLRRRPVAKSPVRVDGETDDRRGFCGCERSLHQPPAPDETVRAPMGADRVERPHGQRRDDGSEVTRGH